MAQGQEAPVQATWKRGVWKRGVFVQNSGKTALKIDISVSRKNNHVEPTACREMPSLFFSSSKKLSRVLSATHFGVMRNTQNHLEGDLSGDIKAGNWWLGTCLGGLVGVLSVPGRLFELWHRWRGIWARCAHVLRPRAFLKRV